MAHVPRIFVDPAPKAGEQLELGAERAHHLGRVLKRRAGDELFLCPGDDREFPARIERLDGPVCTVRVGAGRAVCRESDLAIELVQGVARGERMDFAIAKAVELGVAAIQPVFTRRSGVKLDAGRLARRQAHWQAVALSAAEQSGRTRRPLVRPACSLDRWLADFSGAGYVLSPTAGRGLEPREDQSALSLLVGPEGGLDDEEIAAALAQGLQALQLGPRILRTETAGLAALAALQALRGDLLA